jgi:hypothetical protein
MAHLDLNPALSGAANTTLLHFYEPYDQFKSSKEIFALSTGVNKFNKFFADRQSAGGEIFLTFRWL